MPRTALLLYVGISFLFLHGTLKTCVRMSRWRQHSGRMVMRIGRHRFGDDVASLHVKIDNINDLLVGFCFIRSTRFCFIRSTRYVDGRFCSLDICSLSLSLYLCVHFCTGNAAVFSVVNFPFFAFDCSINRIFWFWIHMNSRSLRMDCWLQLRGIEKKMM
jgi:hypothetical protein